MESMGPSMETTHPMIYGDANRQPIPVSDVRLFTALNAPGFGSIPSNVPMGVACRPRSRKYRVRNTAIIKYSNYAISCLNAVLSNATH
jgi:hypothetical protein